MSLIYSQNLKHFYIPDEQSIYLLSHQDAQKLKDWFALCEYQLTRLGYHNIQMIGKGAFGFVFAGIAADGRELVFKFSRITLPQHIQDRLEEEALMLGHVEHPHVPPLIEFQRIKKQSVLVMQRAKGVDLEQLSLQKGPLPARLIVKIAAQLTDILLHLRNFKQQGQTRPIVHGDVKPSNLVWDEETETLALIDWGSSVFAQLDENGQYVANNVMDLMSGDMQQSNARLGDVYFIGDQQLDGALSSPRFDEQGLASTLYALASGQSCRFGCQVITPKSLGLPKELSEILTALLSSDLKSQYQAGDYLLRNMRYIKQIVLKNDKEDAVHPLIPTWIKAQHREIDTVVYSSRKSFLREENVYQDNSFNYLNDAQFERYYKNYMQGMGDTEKAFIAAVSRLGKYPVVGGLAIHWQPDGIYIDSSLNLHAPDLQSSFDASVNNMINLARAIHRVGVFKSCMFDARNTLHFERETEQQSFLPQPDQCISYEMSRHSVEEEESRTHSYFEDGDDPDELLQLPKKLLGVIEQLNHIHHTGCIIFEALPKHLKIHSYFVLLDHAKQHQFHALLAEILILVPQIDSLGISGFMKLPFKDTRHFEHVAQMPDKFYPRYIKEN